MRRASGTGGMRLPSTKVFAAANLVAIVVLYGYVQWRIGSTETSAMRLVGSALDVSPPSPSLVLPLINLCFTAPIAVA
jgi:hypothetical protein